ncbi:MAG: uncharacterized protein QG604_795 [Candidatus Dependentiae bacterium]|nr:uncharacterized protein [Candidatus Dependentiae bacterium]
MLRDMIFIMLAAVFVNFCVVNGCSAADNALNDRLSDAAFAGNLAAVTSCLDEGAAIEFRDEDGDTPLLLAAQEGHYPVVRLLVERGADIHAANEDGYSVLDYARTSGNPAMFQFVTLRLNASSTPGGGC